MKCKASATIPASQDGAALVTVLLISALILTASIAILTAAGDGARETTDVLSETKAYYAAETGIQATINVLRNDASLDPNRYQYAVTNPNLAAKLPYNWPTSAPTRVVVGQSAATYDPNTGTAYKIEISDPDTSLTQATFSIAGRFRTTYVSGTSVVAITGTCLDSGGNPISPLPATCSAVQYGTSPNRTVIYADPIASQTTDFSTNPPVARFRVINEGGGSGTRISDPLNFEFSYNLTSPQSASTLLRGTVTQASAGGPINAAYLTQDYSVLSSDIHLTASSITIAPNGVNADTSATLHPIQPHRLKVVSTGFGPSGAQKQLEAIVQRNLFDGIGSTGTTTMVGTSGTGFLYSPGSSNGTTYSGGDCSASTGCVPAFILTDPANYAYVVAHPPQNGTVSPPPAMTDLTSLPSWQQTPAQLDLLVDQIRNAAQHSGTYYVNPNGNIQNPGNYAAGTGVTFCEGSCKVSGDGGGVLVVTGKLTNVGGFNFKGMIIVTGQEGWDRSGGGSGSVVGNIVIAPYNQLPYVPENLSAAFLAPRYQISGGGASDLIYGDINATFDNTNGISDFVAGVAEK
jgi:Tfp pilus assembly protein PilX